MALKKNKNDFFCTEEKQQKWFFFQSSNKMIIFLNDLNLPLMRIHSNLDPGKNSRSWKRTPNGRIMGSHDHELCSYIWNTVGAHVSVHIKYDQWLLISIMGPQRFGQLLIRRQIRGHFLSKLMATGLLV